MKGQTVFVYTNVPRGSWDDVFKTTPKQGTVFSFDLTEITEHEPDIELKNKVDPLYDSLHDIHHEALDQAQSGKGKQRHVHGEPQRFEEQLMLFIENLGLSFCEGQAVKKIVEAHFQKNTELATCDLLGSINYTAGNIYSRRKKCGDAEI